MSNALRENEIFIGCLALQWISYMCQGQGLFADRLLAHDCGFLGFDIEEYSTVYLPARDIEKMPSLMVLRMFAAENAVALHVAMANCLPDDPVYRIYFRFRFTKISKVHFSRIDHRSTPSIEAPRCQLNLEEIQFQFGLGDTCSDNLSYWL